MRLIFLPPYSPELNPAEHLWESLREDCFANQRLRQPGSRRARPDQRACRPRIQSSTNPVNDRVPLDNFYIFERKLVSKGATEAGIVSALASIKVAKPRPHRRIDADLHQR
ncbi:transposase [Variovorax sp. dw_308]|uniref:transposase n=1 Tax=Variovorax sp. dw_308 TaxID=2721546 RepID=UPI001C470562